MASSAHGTPILTIAGETFDKLAGDALKPPLVSVVVIAWNHERYVSAAIDSIRRQDYPEFECIVVDNASTDGTAAAIREAIGDDPRFSTVFRSENAGQLGAFVEVFGRLRGEFVLIVDSDDLIFTNAIATHIQVHLALPAPAAISSGAIIQIDSAGQTLHTYRPDVPPGSFPAHFSEPAIRLSSISDEEYSRLQGMVRIVPAGVLGWHWSPGTAIMYRRSAIEAIVPLRRPAERLYADGYLALLCHSLHGSATIDLPLSAWRMHGANTLGTGVLGGVTWDKPGVRATKKALDRERLARVLAEPERFNGIVGGRYWSFLDGAVGLLGWEEMDRGEAAALFAASYPTLVETFGMRRTLSHIARRVPPRDAYRILTDGTGRAPRPQEHAVIMVSSAARQARVARTTIANLRGRLVRLLTG